MEALLSALEKRHAKIGIIGLGYVGLPLALQYQTHGYQVIGFDINKNKVEQLQNAQSYIGHIKSHRIKEALNNGFVATEDFSKIREMDALILCLPTPLNKHREPDLSFVLNAVDAINPFLRKNQVISLESTTYPGTTDEELKPRLEKSNLKVGENIFLVYSPEREDPGRKDFSSKNIPKVVSGYTKNCLMVGIALYKHITHKVVPVSSTRTAEMTKLLENIYRAVNIGLVNEMKIICDKMGIDIHEVIDTAATKPFGFTPYQPGPGLGGHCICIDPFYLTWKAREFGINTRFIEVASEINSYMPSFVFNKISHALNSHKKSINGSATLILGITYKKNIDDIRESPSMILLKNLHQEGAIVSYSDPHVPILSHSNDHPFNLSSVELSPEILGTYDCIVLATDHDQFDYDMILKYSKIIFDTRGKYRGSYSNVVKA